MDGAPSDSAKPSESLLARRSRRLIRRVIVSLRAALTTILCHMVEDVVVLYLEGDAEVSWYFKYIHVYPYLYKPALTWVVMQVYRYT